MSINWHSPVSRYYIVGYMYVLFLHVSSLKDLAIIMQRFNSCMGHKDEKPGKYWCDLLYRMLNCASKV